MRTISLALLLFVLGCTDNPTTVKNQSIGPALGTSYSIIYLDDEELDFQNEIDSVFQVVNQSMSTYWPDSDISKINRGDTTVVIDHMFKEVFELSRKIHKVSTGYFDPTVGVLVNAWGFGPGAQVDLDSAKVDSLLQYVGFDKVQLTSDGKIKKQSPEIYFDFNAIAKGYAIDRLGVMLDKKGIENYLVEVGGEVLTKGKNVTKDKPWLLGIDHPLANKRGTASLINLTDKALASSGNYRKFRVDSLTGEKYVHTIDPKTGFTKNSKVLAASVIADNCAIADAYATTFMAMELEDSQALLKKYNDLEAYIIYLGEEGETSEFMTKGFEALTNR